MLRHLRTAPAARTPARQSSCSAANARISRRDLRPNSCNKVELRVPAPSRWSSSLASPRGLVLAAAAGHSAATSSSTEVLRSELRALDAERDTAITTAESCAKTATKLAEMARMLEQLAFDKVQQGDEVGARNALNEKASVTEAMDKNSNKADVNYKLAAVLAAKIANKQSALLSSLRQSRSQTSSASPTTSAPPSPSPPSSPSYSAYPSIPPSQPYSAPSSPSPSSSNFSSGYSSSSSSSSSSESDQHPRWKWQQSLEEAKERLKAQERQANMDGRMARLSANASIAAAQERIASQVNQSVQEAQERLRAAESNKQGTIAAAQARLRARDDEVLAYVRRVMSRYRAGEYVSEDELEFAFRQLEQRFL